VKSTQSLSVGSDGPRRGTPALKLSYQCDAGWKYFCVFPKEGNPAAIDGQPKSLGFWIRGADAAGDTVRLRFTDSTGQTFQPDGPRLDTRDWRYVSFPLAPNVAHWGGAADGVVHYPIRFDALVLIDSNRAAHSGEVSIAEPMLVYEENVSTTAPTAPTTAPLQ
jgi:hypothetical protein